MVLVVFGLVLCWLVWCWCCGFIIGIMNCCWWLFVVIVFLGMFCCDCVCVVVCVSGWMYVS